MCGVGVGGGWLVLLILLGFVALSGVGCSVVVAGWLRRCVDNYSLMDWLGGALLPVITVLYFGLRVC